MRFGAREGQAESQARPIGRVRAAHLIAFVISEVPAVLGLVVYFLSAWPRYWVFFLLSAAAFAVNFPQRGDFEADGRG